MNKNLAIVGEAHDERETFHFEIKPFVRPGYMLSIRYSGDCHENITGAGVWPTIEKAKEVAQRTAEELLHGAAVVWRSQE